MQKATLHTACNSMQFGRAAAVHAKRKMKYVMWGTALHCHITKLGLNTAGRQYEICEFCSSLSRTYIACCLSSTIKCVMLNDVL